MGRTVLVAVDGSERSQQVLVPLRRLLGTVDVGEVVLLRVVPPPPTGAPGEEAAAELELAGLARLLSASGVPTRVLVRLGDPALEILDVAEQTGAALVAMTTHGRTGLERVVRGSVAERVLRRCPAPLFLCNPRSLGAGAGPAPSFQRILVPLDGSPVAERVLPWVADFARAFDADVVLLQVETFDTGGVHGRLRATDEVARSLAPVAERLRAAGAPRVECRGAVGEPAAEILAAVERERADLVALATHGRTGAAAWWFGSVAETVLRVCPRPVLVVRALPPPATS